MKDLPISDVRNFALLGHTHSGKTTLADALLHQMGECATMGSVDAGTSMADWNEEEKERKLTIWAKPLSGIYQTRAGKPVEMMFIDTPGYIDFYGQVVSASRAADTGLIVVDAASGVQVGTLRAWKRCEELNLPRGILITGLDKDNADFTTALAAVQETFGAHCVPVLLPSPDLKHEYSVLTSTDYPDELADLISQARMTIVEDAAETDDTLIEKYLGGEELTAEELAGGLHRAVNNRSLVPVFAVAAKQELGITELLEAICRYFPSPEDHGAVDEAGNRLPVDPAAPFAGVVFKSIYDPFAGQLSFLRVFSGTLTADKEIHNSTRGEKEKVSSLIRVNGQKQEPVEAARAGDIVAIPKLKHTRLGDTLCEAGHDLHIRPIRFPDPVVFHAVYPKNKGEEDKLATGLSRMAEDDPTIRVDRDPDTHELILAGQGDIHLDIAVKRMQKRQQIELELRVPRIAYRETITGRGEGHHRHKKQSGGRGQFGEVYLRVDPLPDGEEEWFVNKIVGGAIPSNFIPAVQKGLVEGMARGPLAGYPLQGVRVELYDGSFHTVDSSEVAFKLAASQALRKATEQARPTLLEPIMLVTITIPEQFMGDVSGDLSHKRGRIQGMKAEAGMQSITAEVPKAELTRYSSELRSITGGRGSFEMAFVRYDVVPGNVAQTVIAEAEKARAEEH